MGYVSEERRHDGIAPDMSVMENMMLPSYDKIKKHGLIDYRQAIETAEKYISSFKIKTASRETLIKNLSGGNQQKVVIGKGILTEPKILLMDEPSRGIDIGAKTEVFDIINQYAKSGLSIIVVSSELQEIVSIADRVLVLSNGLKTGEFSGDEIKEDTLVLASYKGHHVQNHEKEN